MIPSSRTAASTDVTVFGGYGTFGSLVSRRLAEDGLRVTVAGRDGHRAETFARELGPSHRSMAAHLGDRQSCREAIAGRKVAVNCAGPFLPGRMSTSILESCLLEGCHYVDISDNRDWCRSLHEYEERFRSRDLAAVYGCSSLPGISGALALAIQEAGGTRPERARVTLFIGNRNPKGLAAMESALSIAGKAIVTKGGTLRGFAEPEPVDLPAPFGRRSVLTFESPDYDLLPALIGTHSVSVKVGFELRLVNGFFAVASRLGLTWSERMVQLLGLASRPLGWIGHSGGAVLVELFFAGGSARRASVSSPEHGQLMAALPASFVALELAKGTVARRGVLTGCEAIGHAALLARLEAAGFALSMT